MEWLCGLAVGLVAIALFGHLVWLAAAGIIKAILGISEPQSLSVRPFRYCPACSADITPNDRDCPKCQLYLDSRLARSLYRIHVAEREVRGLVEHAQLESNLAEQVLAQLDARARSLLGFPARKPRAKPVSPPALPPDKPAPLTPSDAVELLPDSEKKNTHLQNAPEPTATEPAVTEPPAGREPQLVLSVARSETELEPCSLTPVRESRPIEPESAEPPSPPRHRFSSFLEEHNILWGELVGGLLIVGCSIALVVTLRQTLEAIPYFRFLLSAAVTLGLFGAGEYTLHRWKLAGTSRGMLVISLLLTPLTLLLLAEPFTQGAVGAIDLTVKCAAVAVFVGVVRAGGRDLIGTDHLPGPIDRRWLIALAVVGTTATQLLPASVSTAWLPLLCFAVACCATIGGLSWYHPGRRGEPVSHPSGSALLMFIGLAGFALCAAWGLYLVRSPAEAAHRLHALAFPLALASVPVVEAGILVLRRVESSGLRTLGTAVALVGFVAMTGGLGLGWPAPLTLLLVSAAAGAFLTGVAFRERLPWVQTGAIPLLAFAVALGVHGIAGNWASPAQVSGSSASDRLALELGSSASGAILAGFALLLAVVAEMLARRGSRQTISYLIGALGAGLLALFLVSWHGIERPATAAIAHAALALGLLASNLRWKQRTAAMAGLWLIVAGTMWGLWWLAPRQMPLWGFVVAVESLLFAIGAVALRGTHEKATTLLRRAARDVSFAAWVLAAGLSVLSGSLKSEWHTGTLFAIALYGFALARLTGWPPLTWYGSIATLLGLIHLAVLTLSGQPETLAIEAAILTHATLTTLAAVACRRQARVFGDPLRWSARLSSVLAVPLLFFPPLGLAYVSAMLAAWLGAVWLAFALLWRERGAFSAFQSAITLAALLIAFGWIQQQPWWWRTTLNFSDPRALHAFGFAIGALALVWIVVRRAVQPVERARALWCTNLLSFDRITLGVGVVGLLLLSIAAIAPAVEAELTPIDQSPRFHTAAELAHAFDSSVWALLALFSLALVLSWRLSKNERDANSHAFGLALLFVAAAVVWAGTFTAEVAAASALRWGLALVFLTGCVLLALRTPLRRIAESAGFLVRAEPWLRPGLLALFTVAAGVVIALSVHIAEIGLNRVQPSGPAVTSVFALMGVKASNLIPLILTIVGFGITAARERSAGYALAGGWVFVTTMTASYALTVTTAGKSLNDTECTRLVLIVAASAAIWALAWLGVERRIPGGIPLTAQVCLSFVAFGLICFLPAVRLMAMPGNPLPAAFDPLSRVGWGVLALVSAAGFWHLRRVRPEGIPLVFAFGGLCVGALVAASFRTFDVPDWWFSFHALVLVWAAVGFAFLAARKHDAIQTGILTTMAGLLTLCALRGGWFDPWRPWMPAGLSLSAAGFLAAVALRTRTSGFVALSWVAVNLAANFVWLAWGADTFHACVLSNAAGLAACIIIWTLVNIRLRGSGEDDRWLAGVGIAILPALALLLFGLAPAMGDARPSTALQWGTLAAVALACAVGLWDRTSEFARPGLYASGVLAVLLGGTAIDPLPVWDSPLTTLTLAAFVFGVSWFAVEISRLTKPFLWIPPRDDGWLFRAQVIVAALALILGVRTELIAPSIWERLATPLGVALLALAFALLARVTKEVLRDPLRTIAVVLGVSVLATLAWAVPAPLDRFAWLHRNGWLFVALAVAATVGSELSPRTGENWRRTVRTVAGWTAGIALVVLCVNLIQQVPVFDPKERRTPLSRAAVVAMLAGIAALFVLAFSFALKPNRDPFSLRAPRRTSYVYLAEVLIVLFFLQVRFNVPELFRGNVVKYWTFVVMALAYAGIGLAELFERKKLEVLAIPLRRTGVLLPLVPLLAFWAKPPALASEFARDHAPGLGPLLGYLEKLPQHFDTYAWLWFLAGGVYGLVALSKKSFGWALLAALSTNAAMWSLLTHHEVPFAVHPQAWVIPLALIVLVSEHINRHRLSSEVSNGMRYAGIAMIYIASAADMFLAGVGNSMWLPVVLAAVCVVGVLAGILLRVRAFIYLGVGFLLLDLFSMIWYAAVDLQQTWVWYASGIVLGVVVLGLFAYLEKRRTHAEHGSGERVGSTPRTE